MLKHLTEKIYDLIQCNTLINNIATFSVRLKRATTYLDQLEFLSINVNHNHNSSDFVLFESWFKILVFGFMPVPEQKIQYADTLSGMGLVGLDRPDQLHGVQLDEVDPIRGGCK